MGSSGSSGREGGRDIMIVNTYIMFRACQPEVSKRNLPPSSLPEGPDISSYAASIRFVPDRVSKREAVRE
jgi:hypothetical protein